MRSSGSLCRAVVAVVLQSTRCASRARVAIQCRFARISLRISARSFQSSRISDGVVVLHGQREGGGWASLRIRADIFSAGVDRDAAKNVAVGRPRSVSGASGAERSGRRARSIMPSARIARARASRASSEQRRAHLERQLAGRSGTATSKNCKRSMRVSSCSLNCVRKSPGDSRRERRQPESGRRWARIALHFAHAPRDQRHHRAERKNI